MAFGAAYLAEPSWLLRLPDEPWGPVSLAFDLPGGPYVFSGLSSGQAQWCRDRFQSLCRPSPPAPPSLVAGVRRLPASAFRAIDTRGWEYSYDRDYLPAGLRLAGQDFVADLGLGPDPSATLWTSRGDAAGFPGLFENVFRVLLAYRVSQLGGMLLHSGAFARDGRAQVVFGRSGAGKSTSSRLALEAGWEVLSDDMNALLPLPDSSGGGWQVERLPFAGDLGQAPAPRRAYPLAGLHWLRQAPTPALTPMSRAQALGRLLACTPILNEDPYRVDLALANLTTLTAWRAPDILDFAPDPGFLHLLEGPATQLEPEVPHAA